MAMVDNLIAFHLSQGRKADCEMILWLEREKEKMIKLTGDKLSEAEDIIRKALIKRKEWNAAHSYEAVAMVVKNYKEPELSRVAKIYIDDLVDRIAKEPIAKEFLTTIGYAIDKGRIPVKQELKHKVNLSKKVRIDVKELPQPKDVIRVIGEKTRGLNTK